MDSKYAALGCRLYGDRVLSIWVLMHMSIDGRREYNISECKSLQCCHKLNQKSQLIRAIRWTGYQYWSSVSSATLNVTMITYPRVLMNPLTPPSAYSETMSPMCKNLDDEAILIVSCSLREAWKDVGNISLLAKIFKKICTIKFNDINKPRSYESEC